MICSDFDHYRHFQLRRLLACGVSVEALDPPLLLTNTLVRCGAVA